MTVAEHMRAICAMGGAARWAGMTEKQRQAFSKISKAGGAARAKSLTPEERRAIARNAAKARWKGKPKPNATQP